jgi:hypothetical protein
MVEYKAIYLPIIAHLQPHCYFQGILPFPFILFFIFLLCYTPFPLILKSCFFLFILSSSYDFWSFATILIVSFQSWFKL